MTEINQRGRYGKYHLPQNWRAIESSDGELLYIQRVCGKYYAMYQHEAWHAYHDPLGWAPMNGLPIGSAPTRDGAMILCREHMHSLETA